MLICAGIAYEGLALGHWTTGANQTELKLMTIYGLAGITMLALGWRAHHQPPRLDWSLHIGGSAFLVVIATATLAYALGGDPSDFYVYLLIQLAAGALIHDWHWLAAIMIAGYLGWGIASLWVQDVNWVKSIGYLFGFSAITIGIHHARSRALIQMEELRLAAERASRAKTDLLANVSHEVRTPMNGVLGLSALLLDSDLDEKQTKMISAIRESADALVGIVDEILDFHSFKKVRSSSTTRRSSCGPSSTESLTSCDHAPTRRVFAWNRKCQESRASDSWETAAEFARCCSTW